MKFYPDTKRQNKRILKMAKKNFKGIEAFLSSEPESRKQESEIQEGSATPPKIEKRATFLVEIDQLDKMKALAYWDRKIIKQVLKEALENYFLQKGESKIEEALHNYRKAGMHLAD